MSLIKILAAGTTCKPVSFQNSAFSSIAKEISILDVLESIRDGLYSKQISYLRDLLSTAQLDEYSKQKRNLPAVTFCGTFEGQRKKQYLKIYNSLLVIDIDKLNNVELIRARQILKADSFVFAYWTSPSNNGLKGLIALPYEQIEEVNTFHKRAFEQVSEYFLEKYSIALDESGSDTTRLCFLSSDPLLELKDSIEVFPVTKPSEFETKILKQTNISGSIKTHHITSSLRNKLYNPLGRNNPRHRNRIYLVTKFLRKRNLSITKSNENWIKVAYAIANSFTYEIGEKYFLALSKLDPDKFNETNCKNTLIYCYKNSDKKISFNTIVYLAKQEGYLASRIRRGGSTEGGAPKEPRKFQRPRTVLPPGAIKAKTFVRILKKLPELLSLLYENAS